MAGGLTKFSKNAFFLLQSRAINVNGSQPRQRNPWEMKRWAQTSQGRAQTRTQQARNISKMWEPERRKSAGKWQEAPLSRNTAFQCCNAVFSFAAAQLLAQIISTLQSECCSATSAAQPSESCSSISVFTCGMSQGWGLVGENQKGTA